MEVVVAVVPMNIRLASFNSHPQPIGLPLILFVFFPSLLSIIQRITITNMVHLPRQLQSVLIICIFRGTARCIAQLS